MNLEACLKKELDAKKAAELQVMELQKDLANEQEEKNQKQLLEGRVEMLEGKIVNLQRYEEEKEQKITQLEACLKSEVHAKKAAEQHIVEKQKELAAEQQLIEQLNDAYAEEKKEIAARAKQDQAEVVENLQRDLEIAKADAAISKAEAEEARGVLDDFDQKRTGPLQAELSAAQKELQELQ